MPRSKKEIDKELMYKKIMPTSSFTEEEPIAPVQPAPQQSLPKAPSAAQPPMAQVVTPPYMPQAGATGALPTMPQAQMPPAGVPAYMPQAVALPPIEPAAIANSQDPVNIMESLIEARIDAAIEKFRCCQCDKCRKAIAAFALNKLPPFYVATQNQEKMQEAQSEYAGQVATALVQAILSVKSHPAH